MNMIILIISVIVWNIVWVKPGYDCDIPRDYFLHNLNLQLTNDRTLQYKIRGMNKIFHVFKIIIWRFDSKYFINTCGFDGYSYLYIQREYLKFMIKLGCFFIIFSSVVLVLSKYDEHNQVINVILNDYINPTKHIFWTLIMSAGFLNCIINAQQDLQIQYQLTMIEQNKKSGFEQLQLRSVHIKGIPASDLSGEGLKKTLENFLEKNKINGKIIALKVIPAYGNIMQLEQEKQEIQHCREIVMGMSQDMNILSKILLKKYLDDQYYFQEIEKINDQIEIQTQKNLSSSGHAFICFDSISAMNAVLRIFKEGSTNQLKLAYKSCLNILQNQEEKSQYDETELHVQYKNTPLICRPIPSPSDVQWLNMEGEGYGYSFIARFGINVMLFFIIVFVSTPTSIFYMMGEVSFFKVLKLDWTQEYPHYIRTFLQTEVPSLCIVLLNQEQENMEKMFSYHYGLLYATIIQQTASVSVLCYLNRLGNIFTNYISPYKVYYTTLFQNEKYKPEDEGFFYGHPLIIPYFKKDHEEQSQEKESVISDLNLQTQKRHHSLITYPNNNAYHNINFYDKKYTDININMGLGGTSFQELQNQQSNNINNISMQSESQLSHLIHQQSSPKFQNNQKRFTSRNNSKNGIITNKKNSHKNTYSQKSKQSQILKNAKSFDSVL
ncbi:hypothetical protein PPERSA_13126 [Pseudocohnilembus persalinus]|uniref:CSC1/OSCA1-like cytosolic domain-containing protein n=1 Tax=Pseudocohnilembus persalinus TaxID=266149 RepID=A0A0V0QWM5_PSEPJ|nr:hypothetical protein PPERSA_13126 [Pseudocohnilembus persalinus]|eukprot:KRX06647.1 hypothetical protein PPERSA_13126 [Pseudocohnilembus persalinus]